MAQEFYSNGKLLLTGEYVVLDGGKALAIPTSYGQSLSVDQIEESKILWKSLDENGKDWFETNFLLEEISKSQKNEAHNNSKIAKRIIQILSVAKQLNPDFLISNTGFKVTTKLDFPRNWGLGSSSTLINNIASWAKVDAYELLAKTFKGSGFDIAAAQHNNPISYSILNGVPEIKELNLPWELTDELFFVHLNRKQNSREGIAHYYSQRGKKSELISEISDITSAIIDCKTLSEFESLMTHHEQLISRVINQIPVKQLLFQDFRGTVKSLGAWGGDFVLATGNKMDWEYFKKKGFETIIPFADMLK